MKKEKWNKTKIIIIVLATLLALSLCALVGTLIYNRLAVSKNATVEVPDNLITPDEDDSGEDKEQSHSTSNKESTTSTLIPDDEEENQTSAIAIELYKKRSKDNMAFSVGNMFPGDKETGYYRIRVSYHDTVTVHFKAKIRKGYEKLAEVMKVKIKLLSSNKVMYNGLMKDMPESVTYKLKSPESTTEELYYEITAYLDTSVGNEYQDRDLIADFKWWVEETGNLDSPKTGDDSHIILWSLAALCSAALCILLLVTRKKEEDKQNG